MRGSLLGSSNDGPTIAHSTNTVEIVVPLGFPHDLETSVNLTFYGSVNLTFYGLYYEIITYFCGMKISNDFITLYYF